MSGLSLAGCTDNRVTTNAAGLYAMQHAYLHVQAVAEWGESPLTNWGLGPRRGLTEAADVILTNVASPMSADHHLVCTECKSTYTLCASTVTRSWFCPNHR